ncbi:sigma-70 family RNA polymerase sigma factor [Bradyrhizobium sp. SBR1B]|uniref:sigma-70 family RNA polymerase sigma factor n=1 Tax=Bradyrhizobium sp. SBR1B TaxID=2663836 RepID=UPI00183B7030|nr:sigma-70 family RNA polymerase sigma factor [Bradyrhizobium sp. SBR1B]MBB4380573.1 RNA polymerase sigma-70 factor (ECF subfamily) [Bradyrhizobium sp. SBR1B]
MRYPFIENSTRSERLGGVTALNERDRDLIDHAINDHAIDVATEAFTEHRDLLFTVAYEMLGSASDAEDVLQETWLRWVKVDLGQVRNKRAYLVRIATRQALNRLRTIKRRREEYVGPWLPEPLITAPDVTEDVELAESVSMALMIVLETLSPVERAVFVLRDAFDVTYEEIAAVVDKTPAAVRQIARIGPVCTSMRAALAKWSPQPRRGGHWSYFAVHSNPEIPRTSSTCLRLTSSS